MRQLLVYYLSKRVRFCAVRGKEIPAVDWVQQVLLKPLAFPGGYTIPALIYILLNPIHIMNHWYYAMCYAYIQKVVVRFGKSAGVLVTKSNLVKLVGL